MCLDSAAIVSESGHRTLDRAALAQALRDVRARTLTVLVACEQALGPALTVPFRPELNPPLWEAGHIAWFADWWLARYPQRGLGVLADPHAPRAPARLRARGLDADALYHSSLVPHASRWQLPLPSLATTRADLAASLADTLALLADAPDTDAGLYFFRLALFHEAMHAEAAVYMAQSLGFDPQATAAFAPATADAGVLQVPASRVTLGHSGPGFAFDNELGAHTVAVPAFEIDATAITWARYLPFVEASGHPAPRYLRRGPHGWEQQRWGTWQALDPQAPAVHLTAFEAQAWCAWAGRRLPSEAQWLAASHLSSFSWGTVWEWTASPFAPFPDFVAHPYVDYSQPWFDGRPVLKGACLATAPCMVHRQYRNYFKPERNDIFSGFRSVSA